jgi:hypothetical protein
MRNALLCCLLLFAVPLLAGEEADARYARAKNFDAQKYRVPALLEYLRFLDLEPAGKRAKEVATRVLALLDGNIKRKGKRSATIILEDTPRTEEGNWGGVELFMGLAAATRDPAPTEFERTRKHLVTVLELIAESGGGGDDYTTRENLPFIKKLAEEQRIDAFTGSVLQVLRR